MNHFNLKRLQRALLACALLGASLSHPSTALAQVDRQGRPGDERRVERNSTRGSENPGPGAGKGARSAGSQRLQDITQKASRGAAALLGGQRRSFSGPTDRLSRSIRERAQRITAHGRSAASGRSAGRGRK